MIRVFARVMVFFTTKDSKVNTKDSKVYTKDSIISIFTQPE